MVRSRQEGISSIFDLGILPCFVSVSVKKPSLLVILKVGASQARVAKKRDLVKPKTHRQQPL